MANIGKLIAACDRPFFSFEFFPPSEEAQMDAFFSAVDDLAALKPLFVSLTYGAGGAKQHRTFTVAKKLAARNLEVMTHLTCVGAKADAITFFLDNLQDAGINNVLALRGDPPAGQLFDWSAGRFHYAIDLVRFIRQRYPDMGIGVAVYPSPHPESPTFASEYAYTAEKLSAGADLAISQLFFDVREYIALVDNMRERGINVPIIPGVMPVQSFESFKRILSLCSARIPAKFLLDLEDANSRGGAAAVREMGIKFALEQIRQLLDYGAPGIHLYTLNKSELCTQIIRESGLIA